MALIALIASSLALAQSQFQDYPLGVVNPDLIYFNDEGQRYPPLNVRPIDHREPNVQPNLQSRFGENQLQEQGIRLPVNMIPQIGQHSNFDYLNTNVNPLKRPSHNLEPPLYKPSEPAESPAIVDRFADEEPSVGMQSALDSASQPADKTSRAISQFGINLMKIAQRQPGNLVISPYSIGTLLALLQQGSLGTTQQQIANALQMSPNDAADGFKRLTDNLEKRVSSNIFRLGNGLFLADGFSINPAFKRTAMRDFASDVTPVKFTRPDQAAAKINNWVAARTSNKITNLVSPDSIGDTTQLVLVNAVYFKGLWAVKFRSEATLPKEFYLPNGATKTVNYMRMRRYFRTDYDRSIGAQVLTLPFEGGQYSLLVILPSESGTVASTLSALTPDRLLAYQNFTRKEVALELPKFTVKSETNLVSVFQQMGIINIFSPASDLSGLGNYREFAPQVSSAVHSALLSIDEQGGTAAAATSIGVVALSYDDPSVTFKANRPFITVLWDNLTSLPLFMAKIEDPIQ